MADWCDKCQARIDDAVEPGERLVGELLCRHCFTECSDALCEINDAERKRRKLERESTERGDSERLSDEHSTEAAR